MGKSIAHFSAARIIVTSIIFAIAAGTLLLSLPISHTTPVSLFDAFFTSASSICVCGMLTVPLTDFSTIGHLIIMILTQIGGLSLVTLTLFLLTLFMKMGFRSKIMAGQLLELESWQQFKTILYFTIGITLITEAVGAVSLYVAIYPHYPLLYGMFIALFQSVSAFCHTGLSLVPETSYLWYRNYLFIIATSIIMLIGSFGFLTWHDIAKYIRNVRNKKHAHLPLYSKIVIFNSTILTIGGSLLYWILERHNSLLHLNSNLQIVNSIFHGISSRGTGFHIGPVNELALPTLVVIMILAFIGSAPGSTGSGVKVTTIAIWFATIRAALYGQKQVLLCNRALAKDQVYRAVAILGLSTCWIILTTFSLLITEQGFSFIDLFFEAVSSFATLGMTTGITPYLSKLGKLFLIASMIVGRIGVVGFFFALQKRHQEQTTDIIYPEERITMS